MYDAMKNSLKYYKGDYSFNISLLFFFQEVMSLILVKKRIDHVTKAQMKLWT